MRYKKGSKVEVLSKNEIPAGSWRCAEVVCGNGHNYTVKYNMGTVGEAMLERVSRKLIRPCPPPVQISENWIPGNVVEVLHDYSWKMATVSKVLRGNHFMVRLLGSSNEFKVRKIDVRLRQSWINAKWILVGKRFGNRDDQKCNERSCVIYHQASGSKVKGRRAKIDSHEEKDYFNNQNNTNFVDSCNVSPRILKRGLPHCHSQARAREGLQKFRAIEKDGRCHRVTAVDLSSVPNKVDNYVYTRKLMGEKEIYSVLDNGMTHLSEIKEEKTRMSGVVRDTHARTLERDGADTSSVGSCSPWEWPSRMFACPNEGAEDHSSDAESTCQMYNQEVNCLVPNEDKLATEIHRLELHAYRCTMEALHASGPLSWEQETLMTNLRISLHISNDEHLTELRNLISNATSIPSR